MQFQWRPYHRLGIDEIIPHFLADERPLWSIISPLICFEMVEWHSADRVMRQFGMEQEIPSNPRNLLDHHNKDLRGAQGTNWIEKYTEWLQHWDHRWQHIVHGDPSDDPYPRHHYWNWYLQFAMGLYLSPDILLQDPRQRELPPRQEHVQVPQHPPPQYPSYTQVPQYPTEMHPPPPQYQPYAQIPQYPAEMHPPPPLYPSYAQVPQYTAEMYSPSPQYPPFGHMPSEPWQYPPYSHMPSPPPQYPYGYMPPRHGIEPRRMSFSASSSSSTHGDESHSLGRRSVDSGVHYHHGASSRQRSRSRATESGCGSAASAAHGGVYRPVPPIPPQEFEQHVPVVAENSGFVNEMIMELLQGHRDTADVEATSRLITTSVQEPRQGGQEDDIAENEDGEREEEGGGRNEPSGRGEGQTSSNKSWMRYVGDKLRSKLKKPIKYTPDGWRKWK